MESYGLYHRSSSTGAYSGNRLPHRNDGMRQSEQFLFLNHTGDHLREQFFLDYHQWELHMHQKISSC